MTFAYTWRSSDGERHESEIDAPNRDAAFAALRERGIKAIKVTEIGGGKHSARRLVIAVVAAFLAAAGCGVWLMAPKDKEDPAPEGVAAIPRPRHFLGATIPVGAIFKDPTERYLAVFAEPGRDVKVRDEDFYEGAFAEAVGRPVMLLSSDSPPVAEFKRIVAGLKEEAAMQLKGGKGAKEVADWFADRQRMESEWRLLFVKRVEKGEISATDAAHILENLGFEPLPAPVK